MSIDSYIIYARVTLKVMKLCRFEFLHTLNQPHSGIFHENRIYETDGKKAIGVHDLSKIRLLPPIGSPKSIRVFDQFNDLFQYYYINPAQIHGPLSEFSIPGHVNHLDLQIRIAAIIRDDGLEIEANEVTNYILGFSIFVNFISRDLMEYEKSNQLFPSRSHDFYTYIGPFITTPEDVEANLINSHTLCQYNWKINVKINDTEIYNADERQSIGFGEMIELATQSISIFQGDIFCTPPFSMPEIKKTNLSRPLLPGDKVKISIENIGLLSFKLV